MPNPQSKKSKSIEITLSSDPNELAQNVINMLHSGTLTTDRLTEKFGKAGFAPTSINAAIFLVADLADKALLSQKLYAQQLSNGLHGQLNNLQLLGDLDSEQSKVIVASLSNEYLASVKNMSEDSNRLWKYAIGGAIAVAIGVIGGKEYLSDRSTKNL